MRGVRASSTVKKCHLRLSAALDLAAMGLATRNVCTIASPGKLSYKKPSVWSEEEQSQFLRSAVDDGMHPFWQLALGSGLRRYSILLGLRWADVNWERSTIHVQQEVVTLRGVPIIQEPKTPESRRTVRLTAAVMAELAKHRARWVERKLAASDWAAPILSFLHVQRATGQPFPRQTGVRRIVTRAEVRTSRFTACGTRTRSRCSSRVRRSRWSQTARTQGHIDHAQRVCSRAS